jgi:hypothetical protein
VFNGMCSEANIKVLMEVEFYKQCGSEIKCKIVVPVPEEVTY